MANIFQEIDGSILEGGGQVLRLSVALSALLKKPIRIRNIRGNRPKPGLKAQHSCGLQLVQKLAGGKLTGCELHSSQIEYDPANSQFPAEASDFVQIKVPTSGATTLLAQIALPVALFRPTETTLDLHGGTNGDFAPTIEYYQQVFLPLIRSHFGLQVDCDLIKRCYNSPSGGGHIRLKVRPLRQGLPATTLLTTEQSENYQVFVHATSAGKVPLGVAKEMALTASDVFEQAAKDTQYEHVAKAAGNGSCVFVKAIVKADKAILASSGLGHPKSKPSATGRKVAMDLKSQLEHASRPLVDQYAQDQLLIFMALAHGVSQIRVGSELTLHTQTAMHIIELLTEARFVVDDAVITCKGIGFFQKI